MNRPSFLRRDRSLVYPGKGDRVAICGMTGEGKTTFAFWLLSVAADFDKMPWIIVDYKGERFCNELLRIHDARLIGYNEGVPNKPGIYVLRPQNYESTDMVHWLWEVYRVGKCGLIFDEVTMVPEMEGEGRSGGPLKSILTQGRSKLIPVYACTQRPVHVNKSIFTEANYMSVFKLKSSDDFKIVLKYVDDNDREWKLGNRAYPQHWSRWYDERRDLTLVLRPCPPEQEILDTIASRVYHMRKRKTL